MPETIRAITETHEGDGYNCEAGFKVITDKQEILLLIDDESSCCEQWGYFLTEQDTEKFIGAELRAVEITDTDRSTKPWDGAEGWIKGSDDLDAGGVLFVDMRTSEGTLQFVAYNAHNGYYGHAAKVVSNQLKHEVIL